MKKSTVEKILELLKNHPEGLRQADIARLLNLSRSYVSEVVKKLCRKGVVKKIVVNGVTRIVYRGGGLDTGTSSRSRLLKLGIVWSSEYPFITLFAKKMRDKGYAVDVIVYPSAVDATLDAVTGSIDLVLSPLVTQFFYASLTGRIRIVCGGASGGSSILENPRSKTGTAVSSRASTMDLMVLLALRERNVHVEERIYGDSGEEIMYLIASGRARYAAIWEPLATKLRKTGYREVVSSIELDIPYCCTLAVNTLSSIDVDLVKKTYVESIEEFVRCPEKALEWYSFKTGIPYSILKESIRNYRYEAEIDWARAVKVLKRAGIVIPEPSTLREYIVP